MDKLEEIIERAFPEHDGWAAGNMAGSAKFRCRRAVREALELAASLTVLNEDHYRAKIRGLIALLEDKP